MKLAPFHDHYSTILREFRYYLLGERKSKLLENDIIGRSHME